MRLKKLSDWERKTLKKYPFLTKENFYRILLLTYGLDYQAQSSFGSDIYSHKEIIYTSKTFTSFPVLTFLKPSSPFKLIDSESSKRKLLFYNNKFLDNVDDYEQREFDFKKVDPFYFYVKEINGDLVFKINPIQLCDFYQNHKGERPCVFCFRNDIVTRFKNITAKDLVEDFFKKEVIKNPDKLKMVDEISIVTGSYKNDKEYTKAICYIVKKIKPYFSSKVRVVIGSYEGKLKKQFISLKKSGVTTFAFSVESLDDDIRKKHMNNRKGKTSVRNIIKSIDEAKQVFGEDGVIIRLIAGMGDKLDDLYINKIKKITKVDLGNIGPYWNINQYMPFTRILWKQFEKNPPYDFDYLFNYINLINRCIPLKKQIRFKISP